MLTKREFGQFRELIRERCGLRVADTKKLLLKNRIGKRLRALGFTSYRRYYDYLMTEQGGREELDHFWSVVTTHQTHFFREPHHFEALSKKVLPHLAERRGSTHTIRVWSAGCSTGQEPYTLAAVMLDFIERQKDWTFSVYGTDIDVESLKVGEQGRYPLELKKEIPARYLLKYFDISPGGIAVKDALRKRVKFRQVNLRHLHTWPNKFDVIFCRNVVMYFEKDFRRELTHYFHDRLQDDGFLFLGSSESLHGMPRIFEPIKVGKTMIYCKAGNGERSGTARGVGRC